jgi:hypothetical protein
MEKEHETYVLVQHDCTVIPMYDASEHYIWVMNSRDPYATITILACFGTHEQYSYYLFFLHLTVSDVML